MVANCETKTRDYDFVCTSEHTIYHAKFAAVDTLKDWVEKNPTGLIFSVILLVLIRWRWFQHLLCLCIYRRVQVGWFVRVMQRWELLRVIALKREVVVLGISKDTCE